jgi:photosystem II stability/assembly factor-like uncharacterized protein
MKRINLLLVGLFLTGYLSHAQEITLKGNELFGDLRARHIGPAIMSGRITDLENHPTNDRIIYVGAAGGGVWKSSNGGASFQPIFDQYAQSIGKVKLDPKDPDNIIWVGTGEIWTRNSVSIGDGLYKSTDGGATWTRMGFEKSERIASIEIHPTNTDIMYVGVLGALWSDSEDRGVYKSTDGGKTWSKIFYIDKNVGCADLVMDPSNPEILYASMWEHRRKAWEFNSGGLKSGLYKSTDGGKTWNKIHNGFPTGAELPKGEVFKGYGRFAFALAPSNPNILYSVLEYQDKTKSGLYRSDDAGKSWKLLNSDFELIVRPFYFSRIVIDPKNPDVVAKGGLYGSISRDGGKTFKSMGRMHADIHDILFDINNSDRMYVATDGGLYRSWDGTTTMEIVANLPLSQFYQISIDDAEPYRIYGGLQDNGSWYGPSSSPGGVENRDWQVVGVGDGYRVLKHPTKEILYSEMQGAENVWRYDMVRDYAKTIQPLAGPGDPKLRFNWNPPMAISKHQPDRFYMGSQFLHKSEDMGETWVKISPDLTTNNPAKQPKDSGGITRDASGAETHCTIFTITESPLDEKIIWVGTDDGNVQITRDGGKTWANVVKNIPGLPANTWCAHIEASVHGKGTAYAVFEGHTSGDFTPYVYKTTDFGATWTSLATSDIVGYVRNIQEDYMKENILYVGTEFGLFITIDSGKNWSRFTNNMPAVAVHFIDLHPKTHDLVMGTHGRGVIIIDDISVLRQITPEVLAKEVHVFETQPAIIRETGGFGGTATEMEFVGPNPDRNARIVYYLKKRHTFGKMSMEIQDLNGKKLIELSPGKSKGINVVTWSGTIKQPKMAKAKTFAFAGFTTPRVPAGKYKVVLTKGNDTFETFIELINDPKSTITEAERKENHETTMLLYNKSQELAYFVYELDEVLAKAEEVGKTAAGAKLSTPVSKALNALKETLVVTTGDNYVDTAEPKLREKMATVYSKIASSYQAPSASEKETIRDLMERFEKAKKDFADIKAKQVKAMEAYMQKNNIEPVKLKSFDEFLASE